MKTRRHHNNDGRRQIQRGKTAAQVFHMARRLGLAAQARHPETDWGAPVGNEER